VLISSESVVMGHKVPPRRMTDMPYRGAALYGLTKVCQEVIAEQFQREHGLEVAALRVGYILSADDPDHVVDKYGKHIQDRNPLCTGRRNIDEAARLAIEPADLKYEVFYDLEPTFRRLGWKPRHDFTWLPLAKGL
jgi:nucleoside-diphosphate-sugar epimerase